MIDLMGMMTADVTDQTKWAPFRSFFMSASANVKFDLSQEAKMF